MFLTVCQGLGLAIAVGFILGVILPPIMPGWGVVVGAAPLGVVVALVTLSADDRAVWPALPIGIVGAGLAALVARDVASGAARRQGETAGGDAQAISLITAIVVLAAVVVAVVSLVLPPFSLLVFVALLWLLVSRRRQAEQKHEGLRILR
jgi:hypothetical protein